MTKEDGVTVILSGVETVGSVGNLSVTIEHVLEAIEASSDIPPDAKKSLMDFVSENWEALCDQGSKVIETKLPDELSEVAPALIEIIKTWLGT